MPKLASPSTFGIRPQQNDSPYQAMFFAAFVVCIAICSSVYLAKQMPDDAYIYLKIAQNIVGRGEWSFNAGVPVNAATSPLYCLLLSGVVALHLPGVSTPLVVASSFSLSLFALGIFWGMRRFGFAAAMLATALVLTFPTLLRSEGMETALYLACITWTAMLVEAGNEYGVGVAAGLTSLGRPEGALILPLAFGVLWWRSRRVPWRGFLVALIPLGLWCSFCLHVFHTVVPHTMKLKSMQAALPAWHASWLREWVSQLKWLRLLAPLAALGVLRSVRDLRRFPALGLVVLYGAAQVLAYTVMRAPISYFWYDAPGDVAYLLALVVGLVTALCWLLRRLTPHPEGLLRGALLGCLCLCLARGVVWQRGNAYPYRMSPNYIAAANWLKQNASASDWVAADEIGYVGVYSGLRLRDMLGLVDPGSVAPLQQHRWSFWLDSPPVPRFVVVHTNPMPGEPGSSDLPWPKAALDTYRSAYHRTFSSGPVEVMMRNP